MAHSYSASPDFLSIGHITKDLRADGSFSLGGTVTFAAYTAYRLGLAPAVVTSADPHLLASLPEFLPAAHVTLAADAEVSLAPETSTFPSVFVHATSSAESTTFVNLYDDGFRTQYLRAQASQIAASHVPAAWRDLPITLLGPVAQEIQADVLSLLSRQPGRLLAATPQGWLRRWDADGRIWPTPWQEAERVLPLLDVLILSHDDLLPFSNGNRTEADAILADWSQHVPLLVATDGRHGATLFQHGKPSSFPAYAIREVDPTGAGDVFAAAFLTHLHWHGDPIQATNFANCAASFCVERPGISGIPTLDQIAQRLRTL
ncbi:PfkB family carbohydrate kinase [Ktedonospora formicarum]|uniref:Ribokinase n=1 Tax=Ktedonospora formicarum TaxID=2778364 RepID=A0A8J3I0L6_9CHLR|nr:PfkB family carbohydrate kinase [Ktedonospora formicarum]GHO44483.1 ribokinase [Ktedonospora formicarum]